MIRHREGGIPMARSALDRADTDIARGITTSQHAEIEQMEQLLGDAS